MSRLFLKLNATDNWNEVVTDANEDVRFTFTFDSLENPTNYVSERSVSVKLPRCRENDVFFGHVCRLDSMVMAGGYDPEQNMEYIVMDAVGMVLSTGSAIIRSITKDYYNLSLTGSQAWIFSKLLNAGYDTAKAADDPKYYLMKDWLKYAKTGTVFTPGENAINSRLVYSSWMIDKPFFSLQTLKSFANLKDAYGLTGSGYVTETTAFIASLIGFAPTSQGRYKGFESDTWLETGTWGPTGVDYSASKPSFLPVLCDKRDDTMTPIGYVEQKDGTVEVQMYEYRSYYQQPFIYLSALWQLFQDEFAAITGYNLQLDGRWFNDTDELKRLVWMLPKVWEEDTEEVDGGTFSNTIDYAIYPDGEVYTPTSPLLYPITGMPTAPKVTRGNYFSFNANKVVQLSFTAEIELKLQYYASYFIYYSGYNPFVISITVRGMDSGDVLGERKFIVVPVSDDGEVTFEKIYEFPDCRNIINTALANGYDLITTTYTPWSVALTPISKISVPCDISFRTTHDENVFVTTECQHLNNTTPFVMINGDEWYNYYYSTGTSRLGFSMKDGKCTVSDNVRTGSILSLERMFRDINPFDVLLCHSKLWHLLWVVDDTDKTVKVIRSADYFADITDIPDISESVDVSGMTITPLSWDEKSVQFNLNAIGCDNIDGYEERYGITYGTKKLVTQNATVDTDKKLLGKTAHDTINTSAMFSETFIPAIYLKNDWTKIASGMFEGVPMPINIKDGESANISGNLYYRHDNTLFYVDGNLGWSLNNVGLYSRITDDAAKEILANRFCWHGKKWSNLGDINIYRRPVFSTMSEGGKSVLFAPVREQYTSQQDMPSAYGYELHWKNYIEEVYNVQNKTVEADVYLSRNIFDRVRNHPLVIIEHVLYIVTEIKSWSEHNTTVRCKMRQISNINNLKT